jgi:hypothetical protein
MDDWLTLFASERCTVHCLGHYPEDDADRLVDADPILVFLFEKTLCGTCNELLFSDLE